MSNGTRWIGVPKVYLLDKEKSTHNREEIEVHVKYSPDSPSGRGFYAVFTPQSREKTDDPRIGFVTFDLWDVKTYKLLSCQRYSKKAEAEAFEVLEEFEPLWIEKICKGLGLVLADNVLERLG